MRENPEPGSHRTASLNRSALLRLGYAAAGGDGLTIINFRPHETLMGWAANDVPRNERLTSRFKLGAGLASFGISSWRAAPTGPRAGGTFLATRAVAAEAWAASALLGGSAER